MSNWDPLFDFIAAWLTNADIELVRILATLFWYLEKVAASITDFLTQQNLWQVVLGTLLNALQDVFPDILDSLLFGDGGGPGGLLYLALMLTGLFLILPHIGGTRLADPGRVLTWAVVLVTLFIGSVAGYDLIGVLEGVRQASTQVVIAAVSDTDSLSDLVAQPMQAETGELTDWSFSLPSAFANAYYPEAADFETQEWVILDNWVVGRWAFALQIETAASQANRQALAREGVLMAALTLVPAFVLLMFGLTFATLAAAALTLIIFFLTALPLGFFEFGAPILMGIARQYAYLFALTLAATILPGILVGAGTLAFGGVPTVTDMIAYLPILAIVAIASKYMTEMAWQAMTGTFGIVTASLRTGVGAFAYAGQLPEAGGVPMPNQAALGVAAIAGLAATGGAGGLLLGALGTAGEQRGRGEGGSAGGSAAHVFNQALAAGPGGHGRGPATLPYGQGGAIWTVPHAPDLLAQSVLTAPGALGEDKAAALAFQDLARNMRLHDDSIAKIFAAVRDAEKEADAAEKEDKEAFDPVKQTAAHIARQGLGGSQATYDIHELARLATLVAATARSHTPKAVAARILHAPETVRGNEPAALALNQMAHSLKLDQESVEHLFAAVQKGQRAGLVGQAQVQFVQQRAQARLPEQPEPATEALARLAVLVENGVGGAIPTARKATEKKEENQ